MKTKNVNDFADVKMIRDCIDDFAVYTSRYSTEIQKYLQSKQFVIINDRIEYNPSTLAEIKLFLQKIYDDFQLILIDADKKFNDPSYIEKPYNVIHQRMKFYNIEYDEICDFATVQIIDIIDALQ